MAYCFDQFVITVVGDDINCDLTKSSLFDPPTVQAPSLQIIPLVVPFTYEIGAPPRVKFASEYIKTRTGGTGTPPSVIGRTFLPPAPIQGQPATEEVNAIFQVSIPIYSAAQAAQLGEDGVDTHDIKMIIAEASDVVGN